MPRVCFVEKRFSQTIEDVIGVCNEILDEYAGENLRLTLRQLYYQLIGRDVGFPDDRTWVQVDQRWVRDPNGSKNAEPNYKWLGGIVSDARLAGLMDWDAIEDRVRVPKMANQWTGLREIVDAAVSQFRLHRWEGQEHYVELWVEKDALAGVLEPLAREHHVALMINRGYSSQSAMYESANRFLARGDGRDCVLLYVGDHDPSGEDMVRDIHDRLALFGADVDVRKVALTMAQIRQYNPPPNPTKLSDSRARAYIERYGDSCWEVDALRPNVLARIIRQSFEDVLDRELMDAIIERENLLKLRLQEACAEIENDDEDEES